MPVPTAFAARRPERITPSPSPSPSVTPIVYQSPTAPVYGRPTPCRAIRSSGARVVTGGSTERGGLAMRRRSVLTGVALVLGALLVVSLASRSRRQEELQRPRRSSATRRTPTSRRSRPGSFKASVDEGAQTVTYELSYSGLEGTVQQAHIHFGKPAVNGGVSLFLCSNLGNGPAGTPMCPQSGTVSRTVPAADIVGPIPQGIEAGNLSELVAAMRAGNAYANVHSLEVAGRRDPRPDQVARTGSLGGAAARRREEARRQPGLLSLVGRRGATPSRARSARSRRGRTPRRARRRRPGGRT